MPAEQLFISAVTVGEVQAGIEITREQDAAKAEELEAWLDKALASYGVLPMDAPAFREWARLMHRRTDAMTEDAIITATAIVHRLRVVTRNVNGFVQLGVEYGKPLRIRITMTTSLGSEPESKPPKFYPARDTDLYASWRAYLRCGSGGLVPSFSSPYTPPEWATVACPISDQAMGLTPLSEATCTSYVPSSRGPME